VELKCLEDCPPSLLVVGLVFLSIASIGFALARWRRWTLFGWLPLSYVAATPFLQNGWGIDDRGWMAMGAGWIVALVGGFRHHERPKAQEAA
jgi:hypothetical protein